MPKAKLPLRLLLLLLPWMLTACATAPSASTMLSIAPTVMCGSDMPAPALPSYPSAPVAQTVAALRSYAKAQQGWAVQAIGVYRQQNSLRATTRNCLSALRRRGLIN